jgi:hypothetical protein
MPKFRFGRRFLNGLLLQGELPGRKQTNRKSSMFIVQTGTFPAGINPSFYRKGHTWISSTVGPS